MSLFPEYVPDAVISPAPRAVRAPSRELGAEDLGQRFEQMLWAEMLSHAGLERAFTQGAGEAAAAFSRYIIEAISEDLAKSHPLGLTESAAFKAEPTK
jgi:hypothetical protein